VSGKVDEKTNVGFLQMRAQDVPGVAPQNDFTVARINQEYANRSSFGAIFVNRQGDGDDYNRTFGFDGRLGIGNYMELSGFVAKTKTPGRSGDDHALRLRADYSSADWTSRIHYTEVAQNFNPEVGFLARRNYRQLELFTLRRIRPQDTFGLHEIRPHIAHRVFYNFDGYYETGYTHVDAHWEWKNGYEIHTGMNFLHEGVLEPFEIVDGVTVPAGDYDDHELALVFITDQSAPLSFLLSSKIGGLFGGDRMELEPTLRYRIGDQFSTELAWDYNDIDLGPGKAFEVSVGKMRVTYSFTPKISLQALVQYDKRSDLIATNLRFAWLTSADTGLYIVYNEIDETGLPRPRREFIIKYSHVFDVFK
jgi:hypothetical protein